MKEFIAIGQIINTHGIKGELKIYPLTDDIKRFRKVKRVFVDGIEKKVVWCKLQNDKVILKIEGIDTIEEGIKFKTKYLEVPREEAVKLPKDAYFIADLIGCEVYDTEDNDLGKIADVIFTGSNEVYWIKKPKELLIPAIKDVVKEVDIKNSKIIVKKLSEWL